MGRFHIEHKEELVQAGIFVLGQAAGIIGMKVLKSREAKKAMVQTTALALRIRESFTASTVSVQECAGDIVAEAKEVNRKREEQEDALAQVEAADSTPVVAAAAAK